MSDPIVRSSIAIYGAPKIGKTLDVGAAFGKAFFLLADLGGLMSVQAHLGHTPAHVELNNLVDPFGEVMRAIDTQITPKIKSGACTAIVIDTFTELADRILTVEETRANGDSRKTYPRTAGKIKAIVRKCLLLPCWFVGIFHEQEPIADESRYVRGCLSLPSAKLQMSVAGMFSTVLRATAMPGFSDSGRVYLCNSLDTTYITGDRTGACYSRQDMDLRPILWRMTQPNKPIPVFTPKVIETANPEEARKVSL